MPLQRSSRAWNFARRPPEPPAPNILSHPEPVLHELLNPPPWHPHPSPPRRLRPSARRSSSAWAWPVSTNTISQTLPQRPGLTSRHRLRQDDLHEAHQLALALHRQRAVRRQPRPRDAERALRLQHRHPPVGQVPRRHEALQPRPQRCHHDLAEPVRDKGRPDDRPAGEARAV